MVIYMAFFIASLFLTGVATCAYFYYTYSLAHARTDARKLRRAGAKVTPQPALAGGLSLDRLTGTISRFVAHQRDEISSAVQRGNSGSVALAIDREFEVADPNIPVTPTMQGAGLLGSVATWLAAITLLMALLIRGLITHHAPWVNLYEASIALACFITCAALFFEVRYRTRALSVFSSGISFFFLLFAVWVGAAFGQAEPLEFRQITPALQDNPILFIHVSMMIVSYAFFVVAFACGVLMLVQGDGQRAKYAWLPSYDAADELGYRAVTIGFPLLAAGIILGAWWANYAWGHYWSWDPKETSALITWLVYAMYLHARALRGWRGNGIAWLLIAGFAATLFTYFGVSFIIPGLHSYGGVK